MNFEGELTNLSPEIFEPLNTSSQFGRKSWLHRQLRQCLQKLPNRGLVHNVISLIATAYEQDARPWVVGYSGGKDSTALLKLLFQSLLRIEQPLKPITVVYCDTGVEIPMASSLARSCLLDFEKESKQCGLPFQVELLTPPVNERFFVKIIGRGYPPPTDKFRWCTDRLRIDPVTAFLKTSGFDQASILLGVREAESATRNLTLRENKTDNRYWRTQRGEANKRLFLPILDFSVEDVWHVNLLMENPRSLRGTEVADLYIGASEECPTIREPNSAPCGKARFGCWSCTVAKNGVTLRNLIASGESALEPLLEFRLWLERERNLPKNRHNTRRNGAPGPGPMTLEWRRSALDILIRTERESGYKLIAADELQAIQQEWAKDDLV